jgi:23S rRNA pseudouridine2605 synthase
LKKLQSGWNFASPLIFNFLRCKIFFHLNQGFVVMKIRLSKAMAASGIASRRACEELIFQGLVKVNGTISKLPQTLVDPSCDQITVRDQLMKPAEEKVYYLLNKPAGYLCSTRGNSQSKLVLDLFAEEENRLFTVGRLDKDTQGLLIVTNDGHFANQIIHPSACIEKEYLVKTDQEITHDHLVAISHGTLVEGVFVKPIKLEKVRKGTLKVTIGEGKKREVRLLLDAVGLKVKELTRIRLGGLHLGELPIGGWRPLKERDKQIIFEK